VRRWQGSRLRGRCVRVCSLSQLHVQNRESVPFEHADEKAMSRIETVACVRHVAHDDPAALNIPMQDWTWRPLWLEPMQLLQIAGPDFGRFAPVPVPVHPNQHVLDRHGPLPRCCLTEYKYDDVCAIPLKGEHFAFLGRSVTAFRRFDLNAASPVYRIRNAHACPVADA
jgi:hypothetical protein